MSAQTFSINKTRFKAGWFLLLVITGLMALMHLGLIFWEDEPVLFIGYTAFNLYALLVIAIPFRRGERWAWLASWILPVGMALPAASDPNIAPMYFTLSALLVLGLLVTLRDFFEGAR